MKASTRRKLRFAAGFAAWFVAIWLLWPTPIVYPLKILVVLFHELSHALAAIGTGGTVERIMLDPAEGGVTQVRGGNTFIMLSAGYLGSLAWGLLMLELAHRRPRSLRIAVGAVGAFILAMTVLYVRGIFGAVFSLLAGSAMLVLSRRLRPPVLAAVLTLIGLTSALYALLDIRSDVLQNAHLPSDARMLAGITGIPTIIWGLLWTAIAIAASTLMIRRQYRRA